MLRVIYYTGKEKKNDKKEKEMHSGFVYCTRLACLSTYVYEWCMFANPVESETAVQTCVMRPAEI